VAFFPAVAAGGDCSAVPPTADATHTTMTPATRHTQPPQKPREMNILLLLVLPTLYILCASVSLLQFGVLFSALDALSLYASRSPALEPVAPSESLLAPCLTPRRDRARLPGSKRVSTTQTRPVSSLASS